MKLQLFMNTRISLHYMLRMASGTLAEMLVLGDINNKIAPSKEEISQYSAIMNDGRIVIKNSAKECEPLIVELAAEEGRRLVKFLQNYPTYSMEDAVWANEIIRLLDRQ